MMEILKKMIGSVLIALYEPFGFALIMTILFMFLYLFAKEYGWKKVIRHWIDAFKSSSTFRRLLFLTFYAALILFKTLLNRNLWMSPLSNVIGVWGIYNEKGELTTEAVENLVLFIPFTVLLLWCFRKKLVGASVELLEILWKSVAVVFLFSLSIEFLQLLMRLGTFQLSDLFYNTLGGLVGGFIYWCGYKILHKKKKEDKE